MLDYLAMLIIICKNKGESQHDKTGDYHIVDGFYIFYFEHD